MVMENSISYIDDCLPMASKNHLVRNIQILQVFFLQDLQDLALSLPHILQGLMQHLASLARKILARFTYFLHDGFYLVIMIMIKMPVKA